MPDQDDMKLVGKLMPGETPDSTPKLRLVALQPGAEGGVDVVPALIQGNWVGTVQLEAGGRVKLTLRPDQYADYGDTPLVLKADVPLTTNVNQP